MAIDDDELPRCFGRSWVKNDPECDECDLEYDCRDRLRRRTLTPAKREKEREERVVPSFAVGGNVKPVPRFDGEEWWARLLKNFGLGAASRSAYEVSLFCEDERTRPIKTAVKVRPKSEDDEP